MTTPLHIAVAGYGTAGQAAAVLLSRDGHRVEVFERAPSPGPVGAGLLLQPSGLEVLWRMDLLDAARRHGAPVRRLFGETPAGRPVMDMRYADLDARLHGLGMQRGALFALLDDAWREARVLHAGTAIAAVDDDTRHVRDTTGRRHGPFDLVIAADGAGSRLRAAVGVPRLDRAYPWGALWCLLPSGEWPWPDELRQRYVAARRMVGMLPVGTRPGDDVPRTSFFWSLPSAGFGDWQTRGLDAWRGEAVALWPLLADALAGIGDPAHLARAGYRDVVARAWHRDRLVLLGDAAHAMSPQLGQGVNMALLDALALRDGLRAHPRDVPAALAAYAAARRAHVGVYQFWSRWLTPLFQSELDFAARVRDACMLPLGRLPGGRGHMLRVLSGTQRGVFGRLKLEGGFLAAMQAPVARVAGPGVVAQADTVIADGGAASAPRPAAPETETA